MKIYDLSKNRIVQFPDYIAKIKLRRKHIRQGGIYCTVSEIEQFVSTPPVSQVAAPVSKVEPVDTRPVEEPVSEEFAQPDLTVPDFTESDVDVPKRGRKRKPKS